MKTQSAIRSAWAVALALLASCAIPAHAQLYWDTNGSDPGAGATPIGTWGTDSFWSTNSAGTIATGAYTANSTVYFAAGTDAVNPYTVTLSGTQSASGITFQSPGPATISGGTLLNIGSGGVTATTNATIGSTTSLTANQTWSVASGQTLTLSGNLTGTTTSTVLTKSGAGALTLNGPNGTSLYNLTINAGKVNVTGTSTLGNNVKIELADVAGATLDFTGASGSKGITSLSGGGSSGGNVVLAGLVYFYGANNATYAGVMSSSGQVIKSGAGTQTFSGNSTFNGSINIYANGAISINSIGNVGGAASALGTPLSEANGRIYFGSTNTNGTLIYTGTGHSSNRNFYLNGGSGGGTIDASGTGALDLTGGTTTSGAGNKTFTLTGNYTGDNRFNGAIADNSSTGSTMLITQFVAGANSVTLGSVDGISIGASISGTGIAGGTTVTGINPTTKVVTLSANTTGAGPGASGSLNVAGVVNPTSFTKNGTGKWILTGSNTYTGVTTISAGTLQIGNGTATGSIAGASIVNNAALIFNRSDAAAAYTGTISGTGNLTQAGSGTLTLNGTNSYSGSTTVTAGTLAFNSIANVNAGNSALGAPTTAGVGTIAVGSGATAAGIKYTGGVQSTDRVIDLAGTSGNATIDASGTGALTLTSAVTATGGGAKTLILTGNSTADNAIAAIVDSSSTTSLTKSGTGKWVLSANNTYTGNTAVSAGTLQVGTSGTSGTIGGNVSITSGANLVVDRSDAYSYGGVITGSGNLTKAGNGTLTLTGNSGSYAGIININAGTVYANGAGGYYLGNSNITFADVAGATLQLGANGQQFLNFNGGGSSGGNLVTGGALVYLSAGNYGGSISGASTIIKQGAGTLTLSGSSSSTGGFSIYGGTLSVNSIANTGTSSAAGASGGFGIGNGATTATLQYTGSGHSSNRTINLAGTTGNAIIDASGTGALALTSNLTATGVGAKTLTLTGNYTGNNTIGGAIVNSGNGTTSLTKTGAGKWILGGNSSYTGTTTVSTGTLLINGSTASGSAVTVNGGTLGGSGSIGGSVTVNGGTLAPGSSIQSLASGALAFSTGSTFAYEVDSGVGPTVGADLQVVNGTLGLTGTVTLTLNNLSGTGTFANNTKFTLINYSGAWNNGLFTYNSSLLNDGDTLTLNGQDWTIDYNDSNGGVNFSGDQVYTNFVTMTAVPEPAAWILAAFGLTTAMVFRRRRNS